MPPTVTSLRYAFIAAVPALLSQSVGAEAVGWKTQMSCASDYYAYCSKFSVGTPEVRKCMRANGPRLSKSCVNALIADGEISKAEVERQKQQIAAGKTKPKPADTAKAKTEVQVAATEKSEAKAGVKAPPAKIAAVPPDRRVAPGTKAKALKPPLDAARQVAPVPRSALPVQKAPRPAPKAPEAGLQLRAEPAPVRIALSLDQMTYEALKVRGSRFVVTDADYGDDDGAAAITVTRAVTPPQSASSPRREARPIEIKSADRAPEAAVQQQAAAGEGPANSGAAATAERPAYPPGRMSLGGEGSGAEKSGRKLPLAQDPLGWWQNFWASITGDAK